MTDDLDPSGRRPARVAAAAGAALLLVACATLPPGAGTDPGDPYERVNRQTFTFNERLDKYLIKPIAQGYDYLLPPAIRHCISNGFDNMLEVRSAANDILQGKPLGVETDAGRLLINSTLGMAGCFDIATRMSLQRRQEDFGLTLARWGVGTGPYLVLPVLGPSDVRDVIGLVPDSYASPTRYVQVMPAVDRNALLGANLVNSRANLLGTTELLEQIAIDRYGYARDAYLQRRRSLEYEGNPPPPELEDDDSRESKPPPDGAEQAPLPTQQQR